MVDYTQAAKDFSPKPIQLDSVKFTVLTKIRSIDYSQTRSAHQKQINGFLSNSECSPKSNQLICVKLAVLTRISPGSQINIGTSRDYDTTISLSSAHLGLNFTGTSRCAGLLSACNRFD